MFVICLIVCDCYDWAWLFNCALWCLFVGCFADDLVAAASFVVFRWEVWDCWFGCFWLLIWLGWLFMLFLFNCLLLIVFERV